MFAIFGYGRVSTKEQSPDNQKLELQNAGYKIDYWYEDFISGSVAALDRPQFRIMMDKIRDGETLIVSRLDRLGRSASDVSNTIKYFSDRNIKLIVNQLGSTDLTSPIGKMLLTMLSAVAELERDLMIERTQLGLQRAKSEGVVFGRPKLLTSDDKSQIISLIQSGQTISEISRQFNVSRATIINVRKELEKEI